MKSDCNILQGIVLLSNEFSMKKRVVLFMAALALQIFRLISCQCAIRRYRRFVHVIKKLDVQTTSSLMSQLAKGVCRVGDLVLCSGNLRAAETLRSVLNPRVKVAYSELIIDQILSIRTTASSLGKRVQRLYPSYLILSDGSELLRIFEVAKSCFLPNKFMKKVSRWQHRMSCLMDLVLRYPMRTVLLRHIELYIPHDSQYVVLGRISKGEAGDLQLVRPTSIAPSKSMIVNYYLSRISQNQISSAVLAVAMMLTSYCLYRLDVRERIGRLLNIDEKSRRCPKVTVRDRMCERCGNNLSSLINSPCYHMSLCKECGSAGLTNRCSLCHADPSQVLQIFPC